MVFKRVPSPPRWQVRQSLGLSLPDTAANATSCTLKLTPPWTGGPHRVSGSPLPRCTAELEGEELQVLLVRELNTAGKKCGLHSLNVTFKT